MPGLCGTPPITRITPWKLHTTLGVTSLPHVTEQEVGLREQKPQPQAAELTGGEPASKLKTHRKSQLTSLLL